mgnify:CR=1 FL=1
MLLNQFLLLAAVLFCTGVYGVISRRNGVLVLMSIELILNSVNINLVAFSAMTNAVSGQVFALFVIAVAAAEVGVGLAIVLAIFRNFRTGDIDRVEVIYNRYVSPLTQHVYIQTLLPVQEAGVVGEGSEDEAGVEPEGELAEAHARASWEYEPEPEELMARLVPDYINTSLYRMLLESAASELGARMTAMRSAADNAEQMIDDLTLEMNRVRQAEITQEILEVVGGAEALG